MSLKEIEARAAKQEAQLKRGEELLRRMREIQEIKDRQLLLLRALDKAEALND